MKYLSIILLLITFLFCKKNAESPKNSRSEESLPKLKQEAPISEKKMSEESEKLSDLDEPPMSTSSSANDGTGFEISKPLNPITDASKLRMLEYKVHLDFHVDEISKSREMLIKIVQLNSFFKQVNSNSDYLKESMQVEIYTPTSKLYDTLLLLNKIGTLTNELIYAEDLTELNEQQKIKLDREAIRGKRRANAVNKGGELSKNYKDREDLLAISEENEDVAKFESWKIKDRVNWSKIHVRLTGKDLPLKIQFPNIRNLFIQSINFIIELLGGFFYILPIGILLYAIYKLIKWYRNR